MDKHEALTYCLELIHMKKYHYSDPLKHNIFPYEDKDTCEKRLKDLEEIEKILMENLK